jgi:predicted RNA-binding protein with PIN domain
MRRRHHDAAVRWLVDGYNVIRRDADLRGHEQDSLEAGRSALLAVVAAAARRTGDQFTVVFDGARRDARPSASGQVQVVSSRPPEMADDVLRAMVGKAGAGTVVASSDRAVRDAARRAGAVAVSAEDFVAALRASADRDGEDDDERRAVNRGGNPRRVSRDESAARRALARLRAGAPSSGR